MRGKEQQVGGMTVLAHKNLANYGIVIDQSAGNTHMLDGEALDTPLGNNSIYGH